MSSGGSFSREDYKKNKDDGTKKSGTALQLDEDGKEINPHIPQYIAQAPWYLSSDKPGLKHQRAFMNTSEYDKEWYQRGAKAGPAATKYRKGACKNCGSMTHKEKFCCERPRKIGAKYSGKDIKPDEVVKELHLDFDGKRDRWNGFEPTMYDSVMESYEKTEQERRKKKKEEDLKMLLSQPGGAKASESESDSDSDKDNEKEDFVGEEQAIGVKKDPKTRTTVRNLRIREDTAKYLRNLSLESAHYDPKSRSMRDNPNPHLKPEEQVYAGDNWVRQSVELEKISQMQAFVQEAHMRGEEVHFQALPSQAEFMYKQHKEQKETKSKQLHDEILKKYGGEEHLQAPPKELVYAQTEEYVEYSPEGTILKKNTQSVPQSKWEEDVFHNNHQSVWGSYWEAGEWGYACCHSLVKNSYCTGKSGIEAKESMKKDLENIQHRIADARQEIQNTKPKDERKRQYNSADKNEVTQEELEAYHQKKKRFEDPMASFVRN